MKLVAWNCNMAMYRKFDALMALEPDVAVLGECAEPKRLRERLEDASTINDVVWVGRNPHKGLAVVTFNGYEASPYVEHDPALEYVVPIRIEGVRSFNLLATWALNLSGGNYRKDQPGPFRIALDRYGELLEDGDWIIAGDLNNNVIWDRPGWPINHADAVSILENHGLTSVYHMLTGEAQGEERTPTLYWRDRTKDGPTYHLDYIFVPEEWRSEIHEFVVGTFEDWVGAGLSDHVPLIVEFRP